MTPVKSKVLPKSQEATEQIHQVVDQVIIEALELLVDNLMKNG